MSDPASVYERAAKEIYRRYMPLLHDDCVPGIAAILRREFPPGAPGPATQPTQPTEKPSAVPSDTPTEPGHYECRCIRTGTQCKLWWNGKSLFLREGDAFEYRLDVVDYTDFVPIASLAAEAKLRAAAEDLLRCYISNVKALVESRGAEYRAASDRVVIRMQAALTPKVPTP